MTHYAGNLRDKTHEKLLRIQVTASDSPVGFKTLRVHKEPASPLVLAAMISGDHGEQGVPSTALMMSPTKIFLVLAAAMPGITCSMTNLSEQAVFRSPLNIVMR